MFLRNHSSIFSGTVARHALPLLALLLLNCIPVLAQDSGWYSSTGNGFVTVVSQIRTGMVGVLKAVLILGSAGALFFAVYNVMEGEPQGAKRFIIWMVGLLIGFIVVQAFGTGNLSRMSSGGLDAGSFGDFKIAIRDILVILLAIVSMVTVVQKVFQLINGEKEGGRQIFKWFVVSLVGQLLLYVV